MPAFGFRAGLHGRLDRRCFGCLGAGCLARRALIRATRSAGLRFLSRAGTSVQTRAATASWPATPLEVNSTEAHMCHSRRDGRINTPGGGWTLVHGRLALRQVGSMLTQLSARPDVTRLPRSTLCGLKRGLVREPSSFTSRAARHLTFHLRPDPKLVSNFVRSCPLVARSCP